MKSCLPKRKTTPKIVSSYKNVKYLCLLIILARNFGNQNNFSKTFDDHYTFKRIESLQQKKKITPAPLTHCTHLTILGRLVIQTSKGIRKAAVLPDPVSATPITSRFCKPIGIACL